MRIYHLTRSSPNHLDYYSEAVVVAKSSKDARTIHPDGKPEKVGDTSRNPVFDTWVPADKVSVSCIGNASRGLKRGVVSSSFVGT